MKEKIIKLLDKASEEQLMRLYAFIKAYLIMPHMSQKGK